MYVCICKAVSDKTVRQAIAEGACSLRELKDSLGVASCCGRCVPELRSMLAIHGHGPSAAMAHSSGLVSCMSAASALASGA